MIVEKIFKAFKDKYKREKYLREQPEQEDAPDFREILKKEIDKTLHEEVGY